MNLEQFIKRLMEEAIVQGLDAAEAYIVSEDSFACKATQGEIDKYSVNTSYGLSLRGLYKGRMGCAATEAMDEEAIQQLIDGVKESAELLEDEDEQDIFAGADQYPKVEGYDPSLENITTQKKLDTALTMEREALAYDPRVKSVPYCEVVTTTDEVRIVNTYGMDLCHKDNAAVLYTYAMVQDGDSKAVNHKLVWGHDFNAFNPVEIAREAAKSALQQLHGKSLPSGSYPVIFDKQAMSSLLATFRGIFSAEEAQQGLSLLKNREGEMIASDMVTLVDDPLLAGGLASRPFDAEGVPTCTKNIIENGMLTTLLHNRKTACKQGVETTGNASKAGYAAPVRVAPTNFFFNPGSDTLEEMMAQMGNGLVITDLMGLHSGADPISGDFSLLAKGYRVINGCRDHAVEQITVAGNFYELLKQIRNVGCDLEFPGSSVGSPSVYVGEMPVAGQ